MYCAMFVYCNNAYPVVDDLASSEGEGEGLGRLPVVPASSRPQHWRKSFARILKYFAKKNEINYFEFSVSFYSDVVTNESQYLGYKMGSHCIF